MQNKTYQVVNGTSYDSRTPQEVIDILEDSRRTKKRLVFTYGDRDTGAIWESATPDRGHIGRSTGNVQIPLLIRTSRSLGGEALLDDRIVEIRESAGGMLLYSERLRTKKEFLEHDAQTVFTALSEKFTGGESSLMAFLIYKRFGRDMCLAAEKWARLLGSNVPTSHFEALAKKGERYYNAFLKQ